MLLAKSLLLHAKRPRKVFHLRWMWLRPNISAEELCKILGSFRHISTDISKLALPKASRKDLERSYLRTSLACVFIRLPSQKNETNTGRLRQTYYDWVQVIPKSFSLIMAGDCCYTLQDPRDTSWIHEWRRQENGASICSLVHLECWMTPTSTDEMFLRLTALLTWLHLQCISLGKKDLRRPRTEEQKRSPLPKSACFSNSPLNRMLLIPILYFRILDLGPRDMRDDRICLWPFILDKDQAIFQCRSRKITWRESKSYLLGLVRNRSYWFWFKTQSQAKMRKLVYKEQLPKFLETLLQQKLVCIEISASEAWIFCTLKSHGLKLLIELEDG